MPASKANGDIFVLETQAKRGTDVSDAKQSPEGGMNPGKEVTAKQDATSNAFNLPPQVENNEEPSIDENSLSAAIMGTNPETLTLQNMLTKERIATAMAENAQQIDDQRKLRITRQRCLQLYLGEADNVDKPSLDVPSADSFVGPMLKAPPANTFWEVLTQCENFSLLQFDKPSSTWADLCHTKFQVITRFVSMLERAKLVKLKDGFSSMKSEELIFYCYCAASKLLL